MGIHGGGPFILLPAVLDLRPLVRDAYLAAGSYPLFSARLAARIILGRNRYDETMCMIS